jgi:hypothetical protein
VSSVAMGGMKQARGAKVGSGAIWHPVCAEESSVHTFYRDFSGPGLSRAAFISGALRELSVAGCLGNASLCQSGAYVATRAASWTPMRDLARLSAEAV